VHRRRVHRVDTFVVPVHRVAQVLRRMVSGSVEWCAMLHVID
jgi:hypothetical protein